MEEIGMKVKLTGTNRKGRDLTVVLDVISMKDVEKQHNCVVRWTDGRPAAYSSTVWRSTCRRFSTLLKDITEEEFIA